MNDWIDTILFIVGMCSAFALGFSLASEGISTLENSITKKSSD